MLGLVRREAGALRHWAAGLLLVLGTACATNPAPDGWLGPADRAAGDPYGAWIEIEPLGPGSKIKGEFLAVDGDSVYVLDLGGRVRSLPLPEVADAAVVAYDARWGRLAAWTALGALSTISHGVFAILTLPTWIIGGTVITALQSRSSIRHVRRGEDWTSVRKYARFPAGLPPGLPRNLPPKRREK